MMKDPENRKFARLIDLAGGLPGPPVPRLNFLHDPLDASGGVTDCVGVERRRQVPDSSNDWCLPNRARSVVVIGRPTAPYGTLSRRTARRQRRIAGRHRRHPGACSSRRTSRATTLLLPAESARDDIILVEYIYAFVTSINRVYIYMSMLKFGK